MWLHPTRLKVGGARGMGPVRLALGAGVHKEKPRNWKPLSPAGLSSGNILGRKEKAPLAGSSHARGSEVTDNKCVVHSADVWEIKCAGC